MKLILNLGSTCHYDKSLIKYWIENRISNKCRINIENTLLTDTCYRHTHSFQRIENVFVICFPLFKNNIIVNDSLKTFPLSSSACPSSVQLGSSLPQFSMSLRVVPSGRGWWGPAVHNVCLAPRLPLSSAAPAWLWRHAKLWGVVRASGGACTHAAHQHCTHTHTNATHSYTRTIIRYLLLLAHNMNHCTVWHSIALWRMLLMGNQIHRDLQMCDLICEWEISLVFCYLPELKPWWQNITNGLK